MTDLQQLPAQTVSLQLDVEIRSATVDDLPLLEWFGRYRHYRRLFRLTYREQLSGKRLMLVADCNGFPVGQVFIQFESRNPRISDGNTRAYLYSLRVMEMFRGRGLGTHLIKTAEAYLIERGFRFTTIAVSKNNHGARRLYQRLGYRVFAEDDGEWRYIDHTGQWRQVRDPCWLLEKQHEVR